MDLPDSICVFSSSDGDVCLAASPIKHSHSHEYNYILSPRVFLANLPMYGWSWGPLFRIDFCLLGRWEPIPRSHGAVPENHLGGFAWTGNDVTFPWSQEVLADLIAVDQYLK